MSLCNLCGTDVQIGQWPAEFCKGKPENHGPVKHTPFSGAIDVEVNGQTYHIDSLQAAQRVERESMPAFKEGRGQPVVFRAFHYDHDGKHYDSNSFGSGPAKHPSEFLYNQRPGKLRVGEADMKD